MNNKTNKNFNNFLPRLTITFWIALLTACVSNSADYSTTTEVTPNPTDNSNTTIGAPIPALPPNTGESQVDPNSTPSTDWWKPKASENLSWQWQLQGEVDTSFPVQVYNIDIDTPPEKVAELKSRGIKVICYFSAGTVEDFRPDAGQFPDSIVGEQYEDLEDEKWLDYSNFASFDNVMQARMDECKRKGFDAIETDNVDAHNYESKDSLGNVTNIGTNFRITLDHSIAYIRWLAAEAHARGLSIGLKNAEEMAPDVVGDVDWMLTEDCYVDAWCQSAVIFIENDKPVFMAEYEDLLPDFTPACALAKSLGFSAIWRDPSLALGTYLACK